MNTLKLLLIIIFLTTGKLLAFSQEPKGDRYYSQKLYGNAIKLYEKALKKNSTDAELLYKLGSSYYHIAEYDKAFQYLDKAYSINPKPSNPEFLYYYGNTLKIKEQYNDAIKIYYSVLESNPNNQLFKNAIKACTEARNLLNKPKEYEVKMLENINTDKTEFVAGVLGEKLLIVKETKVPEMFDEMSSSYDNGYFYDIYVFNPPKNRVEKFSKKLNQDYSYDGPVAVSPDQKEIVFTRTKYNPSKNVNTAQLYIADFINGKIKNIRPFEFNSDEYNTAHACYSPDGSTLFFVSDMPGGFGQTDIWMCKKENGKWSKPKNLGGDINTSGKEMFPYMRKDGKLFFSSDGLPGLGGMDIFSAKLKEGVWILDRMESLKLNSSYDDFAIVFTSDSTGYFSSNRTGGKGKDDVYSFTYKNLSMKIDGKILLTENINNPAPNVKVYLLDASGKKVDSTITDANGNFEFNYLDYNKTYLVQVDDELPEFKGKARFYMAKDGKIIRVSKKMNEEKFVFKMLPYEKYMIEDLKGDGDLTLSGNFLIGGNTSLPLKNVKVIVKNPSGDIVDTATTNEFGAFAFKYLDYDQNYLISFDEKDLDLPDGTKLILTNKNGKEIKTFVYSRNQGFKFELLSVDKTTLKDLELTDNDLIFNLKGYLKDIKLNALSNVEVKILDADNLLQTIITDQNGMFNIENMKFKNGISFDVDEKDEKVKNLSVILITDSKNRVIKRLVKGLGGEFKIQLLDLEKTTLSEYTVDDPWLKVLHLKNAKKKDSITVIENINYALNEYKFDAAGKRILDKVVQILKSNPNLYVEISSHTDSRADDNYNLKLSQKRAQYVVDYLILNDIEKDRLKAIGYGEKKLLNHCGNNVPCSEEEHAVNRRTEFKIVDKSANEIKN
ncbi:MAG TPA: OmpA family protein [Bacteroidia bacterium]|nr:OmpA family protein [Bacteroidia bacterium]